MQNKQSYYEKQAKIKQNGIIKNGVYILTNPAILPTPEPPVVKVDISKYKPAFLRK